MTGLFVWKYGMFTLIMTSPTYHGSTASGSYLLKTAESKNRKREKELSEKLKARTRIRVKFFSLSKMLDPETHYVKGELRYQVPYFKWCRYLW